MLEAAMVAEPLRTASNAALGLSVTETPVFRTFT